MDNTGTVVANTILEQLGGRRFRMMTGAKDFVATETSLRMRLPRVAPGKGNVFVVTLTPADTYTVESFYERGRSSRLVRTAEDIYFDQLPGLFTDMTGLYTRLF